MINHADNTAIEAEIQRRLEKLSALYVKTNDIVGALESIQTLRTYGYRGLRKEAYCYFVGGPSSTGKGRLFSTYCNRPDAARNGEFMPVVRFSVPPALKNVTEFEGALLRALGTMPFAGSHTKAVMEDRIVHLLEAKRVEVILIDEVNHFVDKKLGNLAYWGADVIKTVILDRAKVPVIMNGIEVADQLFLRNPQLMSRRKGVLRLFAFEWNIALERAQFQEAIKLFEMAARFPKKYGLAESGLSERIHRATGGVIGNLCRLVETCVEMGIKQGKDGIDQDLLAVAHASLADGGRGWTNVFSVAVLPPFLAPDESRTTKLHKKVA